MDNEAGDRPKGSTVEVRDRSALALLEIGAAVALVVSFFEPWYVMSGPGNPTYIFAGGYSPAGLTTADLLSPFATLIAFVAALAGLAFPARVAKVAILVAFGAALCGAILTFQEALYGDSSGWPVPPTVASGLWLFTWAAVAGVVLAGVDLALGGNSTFLWRAIRRPSMRRYGPRVAYVVILVIALPVVLFPMFPQWWRLVWIAALVAGPLWAVRARMAR